MGSVFMRARKHLLLILTLKRYDAPPNIDSNANEKNNFLGLMDGQTDGSQSVFRYSKRFI